MNTSTRASFANADQAHASTARTPLLRPYGLVMPQATTNPPLTQEQREAKLNAFERDAQPVTPQHSAHCYQLSKTYEAVLADTETLNQIKDILSGSEWDADLLDQIANLIQQTGRIIEDTNPT